jgi:hypothetical protein
MLSTEYRVKTHLSKKIPCDLKCVLCNEIFDSGRAYSYHQRVGHKNETENQIITLDTSQQNNNQPQQRMVTADDQQLAPHEIDEMRKKIDFIPMEDFNWQYLESIASKVEVTETYYNTVSRNSDQNGAEVERIQGFERRTKLIFRAENAKRCLPTTILSDILMCLDLGTYDLTEMVYKLLHDVHADRKEPRLLTLRANDVNRKNVSIYSRPPPTDECYWVVNSNSVALKKTREHCDSLFNFTLVSAIESLYPAMTIKRGQKVLWLVCPYKIENETSGETYQKAVTLHKDREDDDVLYWDSVDPDELIPIDLTKTSNSNYSKFIDMVKGKIEETKTHVLDRLSGVELDDKRLNEFFELAKDASTGIVD